MKIIVTSWFNRKLLSSAKRIVGISTSEPRGAKFDNKIIEFMPMYEWVRDLKQGRITEEQYEVLFLNKVEPDMDDAIKKLQDGDVLCCWCKKGKFCHRRIVARLLIERGIEVDIQ
jgi:uncharacterized protein (DUF488 family)